MSKFQKCSAVVPRIVREVKFVTNTAQFSSQRLPAIEPLWHLTGSVHVLAREVVKIGTYVIQYEKGLEMRNVRSWHTFGLDEALRDGSERVRWAAGQNQETGGGECREQLIQSENVVSTVCPP